LQKDKRNRVVKVARVSWKIFAAKKKIYLKYEILNRKLELSERPTTRNLHAEN